MLTLEKRDVWQVALSDALRDGDAPVAFWCISALDCSLTPQGAGQLLRNCVTRGWYYTALSLTERFPDLQLSAEDRGTLLRGAMKFEHDFRGRLWRYAKNADHPLWELWQEPVEAETGLHSLETWIEIALQLANSGEQDELDQIYRFACTGPIDPADDLDTWRGIWAQCLTVCIRKGRRGPARSCARLLHRELTSEEEDDLRRVRAR